MNTIGILGHGLPAGEQDWVGRCGRRCKRRRQNTGKIGSGGARRWKMPMVVRLGLLPVRIDGGEDGERGGNDDR